MFLTVDQKWARNPHWNPIQLRMSVGSSLKFLMFSCLALQLHRKPPPRAAVDDVDGTTPQGSNNLLGLFQWDWEDQNNIEVEDPRSCSDLTSRTFSKQIGGLDIDGYRSKQDTDANENPLTFCGEGAFPIQISKNSTNFTKYNEMRRFWPTVLVRESSGRSVGSCWI